MASRRDVKRPGSEVRTMCPRHARLQAHRRAALPSHKHVRNVVPTTTQNKKNLTRMFGALPTQQKASSKRLDLNCRKYHDWTEAKAAYCTQFDQIIAQIAARDEVVLARLWNTP